MNLLDKTIDRLKAFEPEEGYYGAFSGGKDSQAMYHVALANARRCAKMVDFGREQREMDCARGATALLF